MHLFTCNCGKSFPVATKQAGQLVKCSACQETVTLPKLRDLKALPLDEASQGESQQKAKASSNWSFGRGSLFSALMFALLISVGYSAYGSYNWLSTPQQLTTEKMIEGGNEGLEKLEATALFKFWVDYGVPGIGYRRVPPYVLIQQKRDTWKQRSLIAYGVSAVLALGIAGVLVTKET